MSRMKQGNISVSGTSGMRPIDWYCCWRCLVAVVDDMAKKLGYYEKIGHCVDEAAAEILHALLEFRREGSFLDLDIFRFGLSWLLARDNISCTQP